MQPYDPKKVIVNFGGATIRGFADGEMINAEYSTDQAMMHVGTDGEGQHVFSADRSGTCTIRLAAGSPSNAVLAAFEKAKQPVPLTVVDKSSLADLVFAPSAIVQKVPAMVKGNELAMNEWIIQFTKGEIIHSGSKE